MASLEMSVAPANAGNFNSTNAGALTGGNVAPGVTPPEFPQVHPAQLVVPEEELAGCCAGGGGGLGALLGVRLALELATLRDKMTARRARGTEKFRFRVKARRTLWGLFVGIHGLREFGWNYLPWV